jgi:hypothetical protein
MPEQAKPAGVTGGHRENISDKLESRRKKHASGLRLFHPTIRACHPQLFASRKERSAVDRASRSPLYEG